MALHKIRLDESVPAIRAFNEFESVFLNTCWVIKHGFLLTSRGPGGCRKVRRLDRNHFHLSRYIRLFGAEIWPYNLLLLVFVYGMHKHIMTSIC